MTTLTASSPASVSPSTSAKRAGSLSQPLVLAVAFVLTLVTLFAGQPILALAFFGAVIGSVLSLLIDHGEEIAAIRLGAERYSWY